MERVLGIKEWGKPCQVSRGTFFMAKGYSTKPAKKEPADASKQPAAPCGGHSNNGSHEPCVAEAKAVEPDKIKTREEALHKLESDLSKREISLIEREIKILSLQQEIDRL